MLLLAIKKQNNDFKCYSLYKTQAMKKLLLTIVLLIIISIQNFGQQIPNGSFETWKNGDPVNWNTTNKISVFVFNTVTEDIADPEDGLASAKLTVVTQMIPLVGTYSIPGVLTLGLINIDPVAKTYSLSGGYPFTGCNYRLFQI